uniref:Titin n=1 Tax=Gadus morhua TaxID=8049 RepID=A0A8C5BSF0_GADMO
MCYNVEFKPKSVDKWGTACTVKVPEATIPNLTPNEIYSFRVVAINEKGKSEPKELGLPVTAKDVAIEPSVNLLFNTYTVKAGEDLTVEVPVRGRPKPVVSWKKDALPLKQTSSVTILNSVTASKILIKEAGREHVGKYEITLANTGGTVSADIGIIVLDKPGPPKAFKVDAVTSDSITVSWSPPDYDGGCSISSYIVEKRDTNSQEWQLVASNVARNAFKAGRLTHRAEYQFRIYAPSDNTGSITVKDDVDPPRIMMDVKFRDTVVVKSGETLKINADLAGRPAPVVSWTKDGKEIELRARIQIISTETSTSVIIKDCIRRDSGQYTLTLQNIAGTVTMPVKCVILDKPGPCAGPLQTTGLTAEKCNLSWGPPQEAGGAEITHYVVEKRETSRLAWTLVKGDLLKTYLQVTGLLKGNEYIFRVLAVNKHGLGEALQCDTVKITDPFTVPLAPFSVEVTEVTGDSMTLTWSKPVTDGGSPISGYVVERLEKTSTRWIRVNREPVVECTTVARKLRKGLEYDFRVYAENAAGLSPPSPASASQRMVNSTKNTVTVVWKPPTADGGAPVIGYRVEYREFIHRPKWIEAIPLTKSLEFTIPGLKEETEYEFCVLAINKHGIAFTLNVPFKGKPVPSVVWAKEGVDLKIRGTIESTESSTSLTIENSKYDGGSPVTNYIVLRRETSTPSWTEVSTNIARSAVKVTKLTRGEEYQFRIKAENRYGVSNHIDSKPITVKLPYSMYSFGSVSLCVFILMDSVLCTILLTPHFVDFSHPWPAFHPLDRLCLEREPAGVLERACDRRWKPGDRIPPPDEGTKQHLVAEGEQDGHPSQPVEGLQYLPWSLL